MIIEEVELENFISHRRTSVRFSPGVTVIVGPNGAGKTSIVDAITYALLGIHSRGQPQAKDPVIRLGASVARVKIVFSVGGRRYMILKTVSRGSTVSETKLYMLTDNGRQLLADGVTKVRLEVAKLLGAHVDVLKHLLVARQGEVDLIVRSSEERKKIVNAVLQLDAMEKAYDRMSAVVSKWKEKLAATTSRLRELERQFRELKAKEARLKELQRDVEKLEKELVEKRAILDDAHRKLEEYQKAVKELHGVEAELEAAEARLEDIEKRVASLGESIAAKEARLEELEQLKQFENSVETIVEYAELLREKRQLEERLSGLELELKELEPASKQVSGLEDAVKRYRKISRRLDELQKSRRRYDELNAKAEQLRKRIAEIDAELKTAKRKTYLEVARLLGLEKIADREPHELLRSLETLKKRADELINEYEEKIQEAQRKLGEVRSKIKDITDRIEKLSRAYGRCPLCGQPLTPQKREQLIKTLRQERDSLRSREVDLIHRMEKYEKQLQEVINLRESVVRAISAIASLVRYVDQLTSSKRRLEDELKRVENELRSLWLEVKEHEELSRELESLAKAVEEYSLLSMKARRYIEVREAFNMLSSRLRTVNEKIESLRKRLVRVLEALGGEPDPDKLKEFANRIVAAKAERETLEKNLASEREELERLSRTAVELRNRIAMLKSRMESLKDHVRRLEEVVDRVKGLEEEVKALESKLSYLKGQLDTLKDDVSKLPVVEKELEELKERRKALQNLVSVLERIRVLFGPLGLQRAVRLKAKQALEYHLRTVLQRFGLDVDDVKLTDDYDVIVVSRNGEKRVTMLSGGERVALGIAFRIALAKLAGSRIGVMILDEPTTNLDEERRRELIEIIKYGLTGSGLQQLIVITHDRELEEAADTIIEVYRDASGGSAVRVVEPGLQG